jgi:hypothetical protein
MRGEERRGEERQGDEGREDEWCREVRREHETYKSKGEEEKRR